MKFKTFILENKEVHHVLTFMRANPVTTGHQLVVNRVKEVAAENKAGHSVVLSHTQDKDKNPLSSADKLKHAKRFFPNTNLSTSSKESPTFLSHASELHKKGVTHLHMVAGSDRVAEYKKKLAQYNGSGEGKLFNFKKITVHSAGQRDPDAEGTAGMSASKMRGHASSGNFKEFKKGIPAHVPEHHAKEMFSDVRKGMQIKESINEEFESLLFEGVHDKAIFKAVFLAGGPGSGKDYVLDNTLAGHGMTEMNSDKALEFLMDKEGLDKTMPASEEDKKNIVRGRAKNITELRQRLAILGRNGLIINGTGDDVEKIAKIKKELESVGYESSMVLVNTADEVSKQRNIERGQRGGRTVPENIRKEKWDGVQAGRPEFAKMFGDNYMEFDNSEDLRNAPPEVVKAKKEEMLQMFSRIKEFVSTPPKNPIADSWVAMELQKKDSLDIPKNGAEQTPHPDSGAAEEARKMGLKYYGFGRYGQNGVVTHRSVHDKLVEVEKEPQKEPNVPTSGSSMKKTKSNFDDIFKEEIDQEFESLEELANTSLKTTEPRGMYNVNDRKQTTYKLFKFKSGKDTYLIKFTVKGPPSFGKKQNWNAVNVAFGVKEEQDDYSFGDGDEMNTDLTAKNKNQFLIYSTVINTIRKFITEYNTEIDEIIMQGAGERQEVMYQRFFKTASKYFPGWHHDGKHSLIRDVPRKKMKKVNEEFESFFSEEEIIFEEKKIKLLRKKDGSAKIFLLRRSAAKESHLHGGEVMKHPKGYVIKIKENEDVETNQKFFNEFKETRTSFYTEGRISNYGIESGNYNFTPAAQTIGIASTEQGNGEESPSKTKITISQIRAKQKESREKQQESIDKGIEPGLSMAASGENLGRPSGEKISLKKRGRAGIIETIGAGGEDATSNSDNNELELKKQGINLKSFKANRSISS